MISTSLRIVFAGTPDFAACHLNALLSSGHNVVGVLTQPDRPAGRGKKVIFSPVKLLAEKKGIPIFQPISLNLQKNQKTVIDFNADIIVVVAYKLLFPKGILDVPRFGCINVHGSLLPRWRGAAPIQRSLLAGDTKTGITIIQMDTGLDTGDILYKLSCPISDKDTSASLYIKLAELGSKGLIKVLQQIANRKIVPEVQNASLALYAKKVSKNEARINWLLPAAQIERCIRAFNPWPISWIKIQGQLVKIWQASTIQKTVNVEPGTIIEVNKHGIQVATVKEVLNLEVLQPAGKKPMNAHDFLNSRYKSIISGTHLI